MLSFRKGFNHEKAGKIHRRKDIHVPERRAGDAGKMLEQFPAVLTFAHIIETDEAGEVCFAVENLSAMRSLYEIDASLTEEKAIAAIEEIINAPAPEPEPSAEERIAAALEYQNMASLPDETV